MPKLLNMRHEYALSVVNQTIRSRVPELRLAPCVVLRDIVDNSRHLRSVRGRQGKLALGPACHVCIDVRRVPLRRVVAVSHKELGVHFEGFQVADVHDPNCCRFTVDGCRHLFEGLYTFVSD